MKTIIERGASWTLEETKLLLALWGKDLVQRQATNTKRTREVYEKISEQFLQNGFERTSDQVRTRVFNMIAEYRRILKEHNPERQKKCIFYEALHKIYQAKHLDDVKSALDDYEPEYPYSPLSASNTIPDSSERGDESVSDGEATDGNETINNATTLNSNNAATTNNNNSLNDNSSGDSNNNASTEKESSLANSHAAGTPSSNKRIKLDSPKSGQNQTNQVTNNMHAASAASSSSSSSMVNSAAHSSSAAATDHSSNNSKQTAKTQQVPLVATTLGGASIASTSSSSSQRHQSLLLPHVTTSSTTSTPMSKLTTAAGGNNTPSYININSAKLPIIRTNQLIGHSNGNEPINLNGTTTRLPTTAAITSHQLYQAPVNTFDVTSSALLIDRMFAHLSRESENMREWIALEKERIALERTRRQQETEREVRRERVLIDTLMRFQEQWLSFISRLDPRIVDNANEIPPEPKIPSRDGTSAETSQSTQASNTAATTTTTTNSNNTISISSESNRQ